MHRLKHVLAQQGVFSQVSVCAVGGALALSVVISTKVRSAQG